ncbi:MerR family transcriptional regulator [Nocardia takedensis]
MTNGGDEYVKVGEVAAATALTVRTLHYYDEIGLLTPSGRSGGGHRLYAPADVQRLYRIGLLRDLGLNLDEVAAALDDPSWDLLAVLGRHTAELDHRLAVGHRLRRRLTSMVTAHTDHRTIPTRDLLATLEDMAMLDSKIQRRIPTLVYRDVAAAHDYLTTVFGMEPGRVTVDDKGVAHHAEVTAGDGVIWLHAVSEQFGLASPSTVGACTASMSIVVEDVDAHHRHAAAAGADIVYEPVDQPYGYREYSARDREQLLWTFMTVIE